MKSIEITKKENITKANNYGTISNNYLIKSLEKNHFEMTFLNRTPQNDSFTEMQIESLEGNEIIEIYTSPLPPKKYSSFVISRTSSKNGEPIKIRLHDI